MPRTKGSGWGYGVILWQAHDVCGKKRAYYNPCYTIYGLKPFYCSVCKKRFDSNTLVQKKYKQLSELITGR